MRGCESHHVGMNSRLGRAGLGGAPTSSYTNIINGIVSCTNFARTFTPPPPPMNAVDYIILNPSARRSQRRAGGSRRRSTTRRQRRSVVVDPNKRCTNYNCATSTTPMWRRGPLGPKVGSFLFQLILYIPTSILYIYVLFLQINECFYLTL